VAASCAAAIPPVWSAAGGHSLSLTIAAAALLAAVVLSFPISQFSPRRIRAAALRLVLGLSVGLAAVAFIGYRVTATSAPPAFSIDATGPVTLYGRAVVDLRPSAGGVRYIPVTVKTVHDRRGWGGSGRGMVTLLWDGQETLLTSDGMARVVPQRGDMLVVRTDAASLRSGTVWTDETDIAVEPSRSAVKVVRRRIRGEIYRRFARLDRRSRALMAALVLGDRSGIDPATYDAVRRSGAAHVLALSGMHLGVLALAVSWIGRRLFSRNVAILVTLVVLSGYVWIAGWIPSLLRALAMVVVASVSRVFGRRESPIVILARGVLLLVVITPEIVYQLGFQYSVLALAGILCLSPITTAYLEQLVPRGVAIYLGVSLAALIPTAVLSLGVFGTLYPAGIVTAGALSAIVVAIIWAGLLFAAVATVPVAGTVVGRAVGLLTTLLEEMAELGARIPAIDLGRAGGVGTAAAFGTLLVLGTALVLLLRRNARRRIVERKVAVGEPQLDF
jgi:ComEC/Rec2-related protein